MKGEKIICIFIVCLFLYSCSIFRVQPIDIGEIEIFPPPPDTTRIQFLTTINNSYDVKKRQSPFVNFIVGERIPDGMKAPSDVITQKGKIFVCDPLVAGCEIIDLEERSFNYFTPKGRGELKAASSFCFDTKGKMYFADKKRKEVVVFSSTENGYKYLTSFSDNGDFLPVGILAYKGKIWVTNESTQKVHVYDESTHNKLFVFPDAENGDEAYMYKPIYLEGYGDHIYVTDFMGFTIKVFDIEGNYIQSIGSGGMSPGHFARPKDIAIDKDGKLYAVDAAFSNVQIFDNKGLILMFFGGDPGDKSDMILPRGIHLDYENMEYFEKYVDESFTLKHLIYVIDTNNSKKIFVFGRVELKD